jgi:hypothetical protein
MSVLDCSARVEAHDEPRHVHRFAVEEAIEEGLKVALPLTRLQGSFA